MTTSTSSSQTPKRRVNGKNKGSGFELIIAKLFSTVFSPLEFRRSQSSGAILGGQNHVNLHRFSDAARVLFIGDITPTNEEDVFREQGWKFRFCIECKFYKDADIFKALFNNPQILQWWDQAKTDAAKVAGKEPLLIFKFNHTPVFMAFEVSPPKLATRLVKVGELYICQLDDALNDSAWFTTPTLQDHLPG
jgi:hypothetical protein